MNRQEEQEVKSLIEIMARRIVKEEISKAIEAEKAAYEKEYADPKADNPA
jgi:hypothetical protein